VIGCSSRRAQIQQTCNRDAPGAVISVMPLPGRIVVWGASSIGLIAFHASHVAVAVCIVAILYGIFLPREQESARPRRRGARWP